ncbi:MAG: HAD-IIB family hydrolase [Ruminococcaceae bacterium]|nr:HAD-IIB family hydrolase [Oscillospiraceae bacterium]
MIKDKNLPHAIFLDIDGTLMESAGAASIIYGEIPERNKKAILKAQALGHKVLINTGRGYACLPEACFDKSITFDGFITGLGSYVEVDGKTVFRNDISDKALDEILEYVLSNKLCCRFHGKYKRIYADPEKRIPTLWEWIDSKESFYEMLGDDRISKITIDRNLSGEYLEFLSQRLEVYRHSPVIGEAVSAGCSKSRGMMLALEALGIPTERSIAMGDSINDTDVLRAAGTAVAPANACDEIKSICEVVTLSDVEGGVGAAIEELLL